MPPPAPLLADRLAGNWLEAKWLASTKPKFFELSKAALKWPPVSRTFCFSGIEPEKLNDVTYGSDSELHDTLHSIFTEHGAVDLRCRGRDTDGNCYLECSKPGLKHGPTKAVICVKLAKKKEKDGMTAAKTAPEPASVDEVDQVGNDWEDVEMDDDDWVQV